MLAEITDEELISEIKMKPLQIKRLRRELEGAAREVRSEGAAQQRVNLNHGVLCE